VESSEAFQGAVKKPHQSTAMVSFAAKVLISAIFFVGGSVNTVLNNVIYNTEVAGCHGRVHGFRKPWFMDWSMFVGMSMGIFNTRAFRTCTCPPSWEGGKLRGWRLYRQVAPLGLCDLTATYLSNIALLHLIPSVWQMLRGAELIFTALWAIIYRHKKLVMADWIGVLMTVVGIVTIGLSSILTESDQTGSRQVSIPLQILSMVLVLVAMGLLGFQGVLEEELLQDVDATAYELVSYEGLWGVYFTTLITMPLAQILPETAGEGIFEHSVESFQMLLSSQTLTILWFGFIFVSFAYNVTGLLVTSFTSAINRAIYEALRAIGVWVLSVAVYYIWDGRIGGERVTRMSSIQGLGFVLMVLGSFIYNRLLRLPDCGPLGARTPLLTEQLAQASYGAEPEGGDSEVPTLAETAS
jgi:drug/metabolite transporter (DMT)-like permease